MINSLKPLFSLFFDARQRFPELRSHVSWMLHSWARPAGSESRWEQ